jgi:hypothetical protein
MRTSLFHTSTASKKVPRRASLDVLAKLANSLGVNLWQILFGSEFFAHSFGEFAELSALFVDRAETEYDTIMEAVLAAQGRWKEG